MGSILAFLNHFLAVCAAACVVNRQSGRTCTEKYQNSSRKYVRSLKLCARYQKR
ncbi:hypothetical protein HMPREF1548_01039 [Clostridium sp. KLE 1755]|nr:hypothetical protein HMPREF1548_01039 [Clostridium sp. KLE 1755]